MEGTWASHAQIPPSDPCVREISYSLGPWHFRFSLLQLCPQPHHHVPCQVGVLAALPTRPHRARVCCASAMLHWTHRGRVLSRKRCGLGVADPQVLLTTGVTGCGLRWTLRTGPAKPSSPSMFTEGHAAGLCAPVSPHASKLVLQAWTDLARPCTLGALLQAGQQEDREESPGSCGGQHIG